jgi:hypothetical protein
VTTYNYPSTTTPRERIVVVSPSLSDTEEMRQQGIPERLAAQAKLLERAPAMYVGWEHLTPMITTTTQTTPTTIPMTVNVTLDSQETRNRAIATAFAETLTGDAKVAALLVESYEPLELVLAYREPTFDEELAVRRKFIELIRTMSPHDLTVGQLFFCDAEGLGDSRGLERLIP